MKTVYVLFTLLGTYLVSGKRFQCGSVCSCKPERNVDCSNSNVAEVPNGISLETLILDLSHNNFSKVPQGLAKFKDLEQLNLSHNHISYLNKTSFDGLLKLEILDLSSNKFTDWLTIDQDVFLSTPLLAELHFTNNQLGNYPGVFINYRIKSSSLKKLHLVNCSIENIAGDFIAEMSELTNLYLSQNPLVALNTQFKADKLQMLDLSECNLQRIHADVFLQLNSLEDLILTENLYLKRFNCVSNSLKFLDLSNCNLETLPMHRLPNLLRANFKGNHLRHIPGHAFKNSPMIHQLDLSHNAIKLVDYAAFRDLQDVQNIDLSFNTISHLASETFMQNPKLHTLNLSRNYISEIGQFISDSLRWLDLSVCEIQRMQRDSLLMMPNLQGLNMSRNLITAIPNRLQADKLTYLDFSMCGIFALNNLTFVSTTSLRYLSLIGNRLTSGIKPEFFYGITTVKLSLNPWHCDCFSEEFKQLYDWLYRVTLSVETMRCRSPESVAGLTWDSVCRATWEVTAQAAPHQMWIYSMSLVLVMSILCFVVLSIRHLYHKKLARERIIEEQERVEARDRLRHMQRNSLRSRESINRNAPDPREEQSPPSYVEAISMPRLNMSANSLAGSLHSLQSTSSQPEGSRRTKRRRKRRRRLDNKDGVASETQSAVSLTHLHTDGSSSDNDHPRPHLNVTESNF